MKGKFEILKQVRLGINLIVSYKIQTPLTVCQLDFKELIKQTQAFLDRVWAKKL